MRTSLPTPASLSLQRPTAADDLKELGWYNEESLELLRQLSGAADPDLALNTLIRLVGNLDDAERAEFDRSMREHRELRVRLIALLGGSTALGDHLVAHPETWRSLKEPMPTKEEMLRLMLGAVDARPARFAEDVSAQPAAENCSEVGMYVACMAGTEAERALKVAYRSIIMRIAAADLAGTYPETSRRSGLEMVAFKTVSARLSDAADAALTAGLAVAAAGVYGEDPLDCALGVIAMGKCGARELNYISDVDVIFVAEPATPKATRLASELIRIGGKAFFEVDAALRPEGKRGALVRTLESHVSYYKRWAETWEFQALLKARPLTGDMELGRRYIEALDPMVWEASQRDNFVEGVQHMRSRVLNNVPSDMQERELKLGRGGLRDVEFAVQLLQMVHGRVDETLRTKATVSALEALIDAGYVGREDGKVLIEDYEFLRTIEHRLQLQRLRRTHALPKPEDTTALRWLARSAGLRGEGRGTSAETLLKKLKRVSIQVRGLHTRLFYRPLLGSVAALDSGTLTLSKESAKLQLAALGYQFPDRAYEHLTALASGSSRKAKIQAMLLPTLMEWLGDTANPDQGLLNYRKLSDAAYDRTWFLRTLRDEGIVGQRLMKVLGTSPYAANLVVSAPEVLKLFSDSAKGPRLLEQSPETIAKSLRAAAARHDDPDRAITVARSLRRVELARIASADLLGLIDVQTVCASLSEIWDAVLDAALAAEIRGSVHKGEVDKPLARIAVIGMGRLGGKELGYGSDADVMFVAEPVESVGENEALMWAKRIVDRMRRRLSKPSSDPSLEVDLGLRPEGKSGAVARTVESYQRYYSSWGAVWEKQALLRATDIAGDKELGVQFLAAIDEFRYPPEGVDEKTVREVRRMKARVDNERLPRGADRKTHTKLGRGALTDIEWTVQLVSMLEAHKHPALHTTSTLEALDVMEHEGIVDAEKVQILRSAWLAATRARNALVLVRGKRTDQLPQPGPQLAETAAAAGWNPMNYQEFLEDYLKKTRRARQVVDEVFWGESTISDEIADSEGMEHRFGPMGSFSGGGQQRPQQMRRIPQGSERF
ncbi:MULTISPECIES: bifunctional [glutamine synthetase] adenylyltransferase/[glutamine synthetase]-adenylyl-L-tyrosine phosphorylase [Corynebacterium]|uniref:bifunctional [glutamine synthetase] adenylyltransferase/[glutamine synthetase]-adenylyl-L-tyrosine phosphorylase n=1 Tax=Corynebacterium TaxID=1716 RepID=UPI00124EF4A0|nr:MULTISPECIES: bifunctional [glutamine synthetase] adenylyltransferase/[glutamine synthetase]-adenylyl-L-tyrosine phosphorylase [Corynebacterium]